MKILDDLKAIKKLDKSSALESASLLPDQVRQAWTEVALQKIPVEKFRQATHVVVAGMGGSALGARIIDSLSFDDIRLPMEIVTSYHLPAYVNERTLVIVSSYSGNTEEALSCCMEALRKRCLIFAITSGGRLQQLIKTNSLPAYIVSGAYNPSGQPRLGMGYSLGAQLAFLARCGLIGLKASQVTEAVNFLTGLKPLLLPNTRQEDNPAKKMAVSLKDKLIVVVSGEHLIGPAHAFKNMLNENAKTLAVRFSLPEINHHLLEGLSNPKDNRKLIKFLFMESWLYDPEIKIRFEVTKTVVAKNEIKHGTMILKGRTKLIQVLEALYKGSFISTYLAFLYGVDPTPIPWVDYFKEQLAAHEKKK